MENKKKETMQKDTPFRGYRFLVIFGIIFLSVSAIFFSVYFYLKYAEILYIILAVMISFAGFSHIAGRIAVKVVKNVYKKENNN